MRTFLKDLAYSLRQMRKAAGFTLVAIITLALGIGANAAIFTLVHAILLRPLPVKNPSQDQGANTGTRRPYRDSCWRLLCQRSTHWRLQSSTPNSHGVCFGKLL